MFQWIKVEICKHPRYRKTPIDLGVTELTVDNRPNDTVDIAGLNGKTKAKHTTNTRELVDELWSFLIEEWEVLVLPARLFKVDKPDVDDSERLNFFRATVRLLSLLSYPTEIDRQFAGDRTEIDKALKAFGQGVQSWFNKG